jgi:hypothetical protein
MSRQADWIVDRVNGRPSDSSRIGIDRTGQEHAGPMNEGH